MARFDLLIRGATVMPGDAPGFRGDVGVTGGRIADVAPRISTTDAGAIVDASGLMLCPGFIDMHAHSALEPFRDPRMIPKIAQGFTTEVINPDGLAPAPVSADRWRARRELQRLAFFNVVRQPWRGAMRCAYWALRLTGAID